MLGRSVGFALTSGLKARGRLLRTALLGTTALVALGLTWAPSPTRASDWTGANSTDWFDPGNWSAGVPTNATGAVINAVTPNPTIVDGAAAQALGMRVGQSGNGTLTIQNGGTLSSGSDAFIGYNAGVTGAVTVNGAGSSWTSAVGIFVGWAGIGTLTIGNGGAVSSALEVRIGYDGSGTATVNGSGSSLTTGSLAVGDSGTGTLTVENGGAVSNTEGHLGVSADSSGTLTVDGAGSSWTNSTDLYVGNAGTGTLTIRNGGVVSSNNGIVGFNAGSTGTATVDGIGSTWDQYRHSLCRPRRHRHADDREWRRRQQHSTRLSAVLTARPGP